MKNANKVEFKRGQVWYETYNGSMGSEMAVGRPIVIVSSDEGNTSSSVVTALYMSTTPKNIGVTVEVYSTHKRSWVLCQQVATLDKRRLTGYMCTLTESEMLRVELGLRKALGLPSGDDAFSEKIEELEKRVSDLSDLLGEAKQKNSELELELAIQKRLYEKALDKIVEQRFEKDTATPKEPEEPEVKLSEVYPVMEAPKTDKVTEPIKKVAEVAEKLEVDVEALKTQMGAIPNKTKESAPKEKRVRHGLNRQSKPEEFLPYVKPGKVNVNTYTWYEIVANTGIGIQTAQQIVAYRKKHGEFRDLVDLMNVPLFGIGSMNKYGNKLEV